MYKKVENELELAIFNGIWTTVWSEKGYELEFSDTVLERNIISTVAGDYVGTSEIKPYYGDDRSEINKLAPFSNHPWVQSSNYIGVEIDKIAVLKSYRTDGNHISQILSSVIHSTKPLNIKYGVTLLEPIFRRALKITFKIPMEIVGEKIYYKGDYVVPTIIDLSYIANHLDQFSWYKAPKEVQYN